MNGKPTVVSLFCGTGGSSLGYKNAGFHEVLAVDFDEHAEQCFKLNFPEVKFIRADISKLTGEKILELTGIKKGELDCLDGSPPCQGFSMAAGKRDVQDTRNDLLSHYVRLINEIEPKNFVMENVPGMIAGKMRGRWKLFWESLPHSEYKIVAKILNSKFYGVPQARRRVFVLGSKIFTPNFPLKNEKIITVYDVLKDVVPSEKFELKDEFKNLYFSLPRGSNGARHTPGLNFGFGKIAKHKPSSTVVKFQTKHGFGTMCHYDEPRPLAINEALILTSFPADWKMVGKYEEKWARIGNCVPPKMMEAVARNLLQQMQDAQKTSVDKSPG